MSQGRLERISCRKCGRLLLRAYLPPPCEQHPPATIEEKCYSCNEMNLITSAAVDEVIVPDGLGGYLTRKAPVS